MDPISLVGLIAAGAQNVMSSAGGFLSSAMQYQQNKKLQDRAFQHQIRMYRNAHQWEVEDLRKAGLNPILSTHSASGASSAPTASVSAPHFALSGDPVDALVQMQGFSSAKDLQKFNRENHEVDLATKEAILSRQDAEADFIRAQTNKLDASTARDVFDLDFLRDEDYNYLRKLDLVHRVFPVDGDVGFNVGKGKKGKGFGAHLNLGDGYNALGRMYYYRKFNEPVKSVNSALRVRKSTPDRPSTSYRYKYHKNY